MDKKNTIIGVALLIAAFAIFFFGPHSAPPPPPQTISRPPVSAPAAATPESPAVSSAPAQSDAAFAAIANDSAEATITTLNNGFIEVRLTDFGGAIRDVAFKQYGAEVGNPAPFVFNRDHADPILAFTEASSPNLGRTTRYRLVSATPTEVVYRAVVDNRLEVTRRYGVTSPAKPGSADPSVYIVRHETTFRNLTQEAAALPRISLSLGTASLVSLNDYGQYLNIASYDGNATQFTDRSELEGAGFLGRMMGRDTTPKAFVEKSGTVVWAAVKNQFFASIFTADRPGQAVITRRVQPAAVSRLAPRQHRPDRSGTV